MARTKAKKPKSENRLIYGDNLDVLRQTEYFPGEMFDLIYLDPPFNSSANYNIIFRELDETLPASQVQTFQDTWTWDTTAQRLYQETVNGPHTKVGQAMAAFYVVLGRSKMMAYLANMAPRLIELKRVLKSTGSIYLHCDSTASHYLKGLMDSVFGPTCYVNEIIWRRHNSRSSTDQMWPRLHDTLLMYSKSDEFFFAPTIVEADHSKQPHTLIKKNGKLYQTYELTAPEIRGADTDSGRPWRDFNPGKMGRHWSNSHAQMDQWDDRKEIHWPKNNGFPRRISTEPYIPENRKIAVGDVWTDIDRLNQTAKERLGYPTQKPEKLLERIIQASSKPGDMILDPFCGCGTAVAVAQRLGRRWYGIDVTHLAINLIGTRLTDSFGGQVGDYCEVIGVPTDMAGARKLFADDPYQFQYWALSLVRARPAPSEQKKGADQGVDGRRFFHDTFGDEKPRQIVFSVKGGDLKADDVRSLGFVVDREKADIGVLISLEKPTRGMRNDANDAGHYTFEMTGQQFPKLQLLTIEDLLVEGKGIEHPPWAEDRTFKKAAKSAPASTERTATLFDMDEDDG